MRAASTLLLLACLGPIAHADSDDAAVGEAMTVSGSHRGVSQNYLVLPSGGELTAQMRFLTAEPSLGDAKLAFSDLALFGISARYSLFSRLELSGRVELLPKQPSYTSEKPWQSVAFVARSPIGNTAAVAIHGSGGHLLGHDGSWLRQGISLEFRKPIHEVLTFDIHGGLDSTALVRDGHDGGWVTELGVSGQALFRDPNGKVGGWVGMAYSIPVASRGNDPTTDMPLDPQARLDFRVGGVISLVREWDLFAEYAVIDRGDLSDPSTRLPILDGGFDQHQVMFGVTRHIAGKKPSSGGDDDDSMQLAGR